MLLDATGRRIVTKATLAMTPDQVRWFLNGKAFLRHLGDLHTVKVAAYCQGCYAAGLHDDVMAGKADDDTYVIRCAHRQRLISRASVRDTDELLARLGWSLRCVADCERKGMHDGIQGNNDPQAAIASIDCGCTERKYAAPVGSA